MSAAEALALTPAERAQVAARERLKGLGEVDVVKTWYATEEPFDLNDREDAIRQRWDFAKAKFLALANYGETVAALQAEFGISVAQARNDIRHMRHAFGNLDEVPKALHRERAIQMALKAYTVAEQAKDSDGMSKATKAYIMAAGLDRDDTERFDIEKAMSERVYVEALDPAVRSLMLNFLQQGGGSLDASTLFEQVYAAKGEEFVDYENVNETT